MMQLFGWPVCFFIAETVIGVIGLVVCLIREKRLRRKAVFEFYGRG